MNRAYSVIEIKSVDDEQRIIEGVATTPTPDRTGDIVEPMGAKFSLPLPLLWQHDTKNPVGHVEAAKKSKDGITFKARIAKIDEPGELKNFLDKAWQSVKANLVRGISIGFKSIERSLLESGGIRFLEWEWLELSLVTVPANAEATVQRIKSIDTDLRAASGHRGVVRLLPPGATGKQPLKSAPKEGREMKTLAEQITGFEATRVAKAARMSAIMDEAAEKGETLDAAQKEEYDGLKGAVIEIDEHLVRLADQEKINKAAAKSVGAVTTPAEGSAARSGVVIVKGDNLPKGTAFTRYAIALARAKGNVMQAMEISKSWHDSTPEVEAVLKAAVTAGTTTDADWAQPLAEYTNMASEFVALLRPATIIGRIPGLRRVPFNIKMPTQTQGASANWVGEGVPKPVSELKFGQITLGMAKAAGIVILSEELVRSSNPSAEAIVRQDLIDTITQFLDLNFVDPAVAAVANVSPASITNGVTPITASGTNEAALRADLLDLIGTFVSTNQSLSGAGFIMTETSAMAIAMMMNPLGQPSFPNITMNGGTLLGIPVVTSENVPSSLTSGGGSRIILAKANEILLADDGGVTLDVSREASVQMDSAPTNPPTASTVMVSLWQMNLVGIRAERFINWAKRRSTAVAYIDHAAYG